ncbi:unnamed protein product [Rotaria sp. Silwood1]|nr:unnamed protein product [Rotaria sp. Silwood1]CAF4769300.1 unnamed protein product [Rotaria sp. Silwood1]CAF4920868.1 unnamed protein product [Rotaria sp. Silwood1]
MLYYQKHGFIMNKTQLEPNEVIVEIKGIGLNPVDIQLAKIPGADFSGRIYKIGDEVFGLNLSIAGNGCLSQYIKLSENMSSMTHKPTNLSHNEAAAIPLVFLTVYTALHD